MYNFVREIKLILMEGIETFEDVKCYIGDTECSHEGYVMSNKYGTYKLVNRKQFSYANFTVKQEWKR